MKPSTTVISARTLCDANEQVLSACAKFAAQNQRKDMSPIFVIVPDRYTLQAERILLSGGGAFLNLRVVTFSMLFKILHGQSGADADNIFDKTSAVLLMWRAIRDVRDGLLYFGPSVDIYAFAERMFNTVNQLESCRADFATLQRHARTEITRAKMHDISIIQKRYKELCRDKIDGAGMLAWLIQNVAGHPTVKDAHFYMTGFEYISKQREEIFRRISRSARSFTLGVRDQSELHKSVESETTIKSTKKAAIISPQTSEYENTFQEAQGLCNKICELVYSGVRYQDINVVVCDFATTRDIYRATFDAFDIPINMDTAGNLMDAAMAKHLRDTLLGHPWAPTEKFRAKTVRDFCAAMRDFISDARCGEDCLSKEPQRSGSGPAKRDASSAAASEEEMKSRIVEVLSSIASISGDMQITRMEFCNMLCSVLTAVKLTGVPDGLDRVMVTDLAEFVPTHTPHLFIVGASTETFPGSVPDTDIITEQDITDMRIPIEPTAKTQTMRLHRHANNVIQSATAGVHISHTDTSASSGGVPLREGACNEDCLDKEPLDIFSPVFARTHIMTAIGSGSAHADPAAGVYFASLRVASGIGNFKMPTIATVSGHVEHADLMVPGGKLSVTAVEDFYKCPHYHFVTRTLGAREKDPIRGISPAVAGEILHTFCERILKTPTNPQDKIIAQILREYKLPAFAVRAIKKRCRDIAEYLLHEQSTSEFTPTHFEYPIDEVVDEIKVTGKIDRVDTRGKECIVVDYKSGSPGYAGLQVPIYMKMLQSRGLVPAGGYYLNLKELKPTKFTPESIDEKYQAFSHAIAGIKSGEVSMRPIHKDICKYCPMRGVCEVQK